jgi:hypothetical protein
MRATCHIQLIRLNLITLSYLAAEHITELNYSSFELYEIENKLTLVRCYSSS